MIENIIKDYSLYIIVAESIIIIALLLWVFLFSDDGSDEIRSLEHDKQYIKDQLSSVKKELNSNKKAYSMVCSELNQYKKFYDQYCQQNTKREQPTIIVGFDHSQDLKPQTNLNQVLYQYLQEANDGKFMRLLLSPEKCYFRTWEEGGVRKYEFSGNAAKALANINAIFDDVCEIEGKRNGATDIENVSAGILDSELRITSKAKIRLK